MGDNISYNDLMWSLEDEKESLKKDNDKPEIKKMNNEMVSEVKKSKADNKKSIVDKMKEIPAKADSINKNFKLWARKRKNLGFYKKYLDRVRSGLYERNSGEAEVTESLMFDDPVTILKGPAQSYIKHLVKRTNELYKQVTQMSEKLENATSAEEAINVVKGYCKSITGKSQNIKGDMIDDEKSSWKERIIRATRYKIAEILFKGRETGIYGYTVKSCVLKRFPEPNHLIVTLFCRNPEEVPRPQPVSDIFTSVDSFDILANSDKTDIFNVANMTAAILNKTVDGNVMNEIKSHKESAIANFKDADIEDKKAEAKIIDSIWNGINASCKLLLGQKSYLIKCINVYFDMILRIDKLAVKAIEEMLEVENKYRDERYDKHSKISHAKRKPNKYTDEGRAEIEKQWDKKERAAKISDTTRRLNKM